MTDEASTAPPATSRLAALFAAALSAGAVNVAVSLLDRPRAFESAGELAAPLAASVALFLVALGVVFLLAGAVPRVRIDPGAWAFAAAGGATVVAVLGPLAAVLGRDVSAPRAPALGIVLVACVLSVWVATYFVAGATAPARRARFASALALGAPLVAFELLGALWLLQYPLAAAAGFVRIGLVLVLAALAFATLRYVALRRPAPALVVLAALVLASPFGVEALGRGSGSEGAPSGTVPDPPRVLLVTVDTLRPDVLAETDTPGIDALLSDSVVFTNARSAAPWTKPAMATILTGVTPPVHGTSTRRSRLPDELETLAESLRSAGYRTVGLGLNVHLERAFGFAQGFDEYVFPARGDYGTSFGARLLQILWPKRYPKLFPSTEAITDVAIDWIDAHADEPFFLWIHLLDPHWPYAPPPSYVEGEPTPRIGGEWGDHETVTNVQAGNTKLGPADRERVRELYRAEIRYADANLRRLMARLQGLGLYDDALIVFASDHGEEFWEHGTFEHGHTMYDEVLRVPLAFKLPGASGRAEPMQIDAPVSTAALTPTVLELAGIGADAERFDAASLTPWWTDGADPAPSPLFGSATYYHGEKRSVLFDGKKLVLDVETGRVELYDLADDPEELRSIAASHPNDVEHGLELLRESLEASGALRDRLGIRADTTADLDALDRARMQALGYAGNDG